MPSRRNGPLQRARSVWGVTGIICALALAALFAAAPSQANATRVSEGDAQAVLDAWGNGGAAIIDHQPMSSGAPADIELQASIRPFQNWNGRHFCADDWHVILVAEIAGGDEHFTVQDAEAEIGSDSLVFHLDGALLATERLPLKAFLDPERLGLQTAFYFQQGALMAPSALSAGQHTVALQITAPDGSFELTIQIYIDPSGTGACL